MTQDNNIPTDTPQESSNEYASLEEAVFGEGSQDTNSSSAFTSGNEGNTETAPAGQPEVSNQENTQAPVLSGNDEKRYQYWQSQADKYKNELESMRQTQQQQMAQQPVQQPVQQGPEGPVEPQQEMFPAAPPKPQRPRAFNREEAYGDPSSESARYIDELEGWRDDMNEYNNLKSEYQTAVIEEKFNGYEQQRVQEAQRQQAMQQQVAQQNEIHNHLTGHYGMQENEATDFMNTMSNPNSINIDNLVQLYRMQSGNAAPQVNPAPAQPSEAFTQTKNAQQVPSPMGVMPSGNTNVDGRTFEDKIMDKMIGSFNSKNPWK